MLPPPSVVLDKDVLRDAEEAGVKAVDLLIFGLCVDGIMGNGVELVVVAVIIVSILRLSVAKAIPVFEED